MNVLASSQLLRSYQNMAQDQDYLKEIPEHQDLLIIIWSKIKQIQVIFTHLKWQVAVVRQFGCR